MRNIIAKFADKSEDGLIPRFIKAVNGESEAQYSYTPNKNGVDNVDWPQYNLYTATDEFIRDVPIAPYNDKTKKLLEVARSEKNRINKDTEIASVWTESVRNAERGSSSDSGVPRRGRSSSDDRLLGASSERNSSRDNERIWSTYETKEEVDAIVQKLKDVYGLNEEPQYSYTPKREEQLEEWMAQYKSGEISDEEFKRNVMRVKPQTAPLSLAHITEADVMEMANTTPKIKKKTGRVLMKVLLFYKNLLIFLRRCDIITTECKLYLPL